MVKVNGRNVVSIMKACDIAGVSRRTIYNWLKSGKIEFIRTAGGSVRIYVDTLFRGPDERVREAQGFERPEYRKDSRV